jgi:hypothetical protein
MPTVPTLTLTETMIHEVPRGKRKDDGDDVVLSASPTDLNSATDRFIREEMLQPSFAAGREIVHSDRATVPIPGLLRGVLENPDLLIENSAAMARHLHATQPGGASAGIFLCARAVADGVDRIVLMKAEHSEGMRLQQVVDTNGQVTFVAEHLNELILGQKAQVYKIALVWLNGADQLVGLMVDRQNGVGYAEYFLQYLGFDLVHQAEKLVLEFTQGMTSHINGSDYSPEKKGRYLSALAAVLQSPNQRLNPGAFIREFIDPEDRHAAHASLPTQVANMDFRKDTTLVHHLIGGLKLSTDNGVTISASASAIESGVVEVKDEEIVVHAPASGYKLGKAP